MQYLFYTQWQSLREYCNRKGVRLIGDIPIYVALDSCDTWVNTRLFEYDESCQPLRVAGCPPDYFSRTGQLWGNPLYRWDVMEREDFAWWVERIGAMSRLFDLIRIDHFRGFAGYYAIDAGEQTAEHGRWERGPGEKLFTRLREQLPQARLIAEDLGTITPDVEQLRDRFGFPGMKVLQVSPSPRRSRAAICRTTARNGRSSTPAPTTTTPAAAGRAAQASRSAGWRPPTWGSKRRRTLLGAWSAPHG